MFDCFLSDFIVSLCPMLNFQVLSKMRHIMSLLWYYIINKKIILLMIPFSCLHLQKQAYWADNSVRLVFFNLCYLELSSISKLGDNSLVFARIS